MSTNFADIFISNVEDLDVEKSLSFLPKIRVEKVRKLAKEKDKKLSAGVYILLCKALEKYDINASKYAFKYDENGKPFLEGCQIHFSLSHSGSYVAVAISNNPVGIDIQEMKVLDLSARKYIFSDRDEKDFQNSNDKLDFFFKIWTAKEALYKLDRRSFKKDYEDSCFFVKIHQKYLVAVTSKNVTKIEEIEI